MGRPPIGSTGVMVKVPPDLLGSIDQLISRDAARPSRPEFIRRIVGMILGHGEIPSRLKNFRCIPDGLVVLDVSRILSIAPDGVYSKVTLLGGATFDLWEEPDRLAGQLGYHLRLGDSWCHPDFVVAIEQGSGRSVVHLVDGQMVPVAESWEKVSHAVDEARRLHGTPPVAPPGNANGAARLAKRHTD